MFKRKLLVVPLVVAFLFAAIVGGVTLAQDGSADVPSDKSTVKQRVAEILGVSPEELEDAFKQAISEARTAKIDDHLQALVDKGLLDASQAEEYKEWFGAMPEGLKRPFFGGRRFGQHRFEGPKFGGLEFKKRWFQKKDSSQSRPLNNGPELSSY